MGMRVEWLEVDAGAKTGSFFVIGTEESSCFKLEILTDITVKLLSAPQRLITHATRRPDAISFHAASVAIFTLPRVFFSVDHP